MAQSREAHAYLAALEQVRELLCAFDVTTYAYDPGVGWHWQPTPDHPPRKIDLGANEWTWLEPLLRELQHLRRQNNGVDGVPQV